TPNLGFEMLGPARKRTRFARACRHCGTPLALLATYRRTSYIPLERYAAIILEICPPCARESDGAAGANGYTARFVGPKGLETSVAAVNRHVPKPLHFRATPTREPASPRRFARWKRGRLHAKLGGRQISIQPEDATRRCSRCGGAWRFVGSISE